MSTGREHEFKIVTKGQLISELLFDVLNFPKNRQISALESKKWSIHKIKANYNDFDTNYGQIILNIIRRCIYFVDLTNFFYSRAEICFPGKKIECGLAAVIQL